jgi:predicted phage terminase large subunit-like protein
MIQMTNLPASRLAEIVRADFCSFIHCAFLDLYGPSLFRCAPYLEVVAEKLEDVRRGRIKRLIINLPPRSLKSFAASVAFPAFVLGHDPAKKIITCSYGQDLSEKFARECRALMKGKLYSALFETRLSPDRQAVNEFETTRGGYRLSTSVGGVLTGRGADLIIIDDPLKADDALSGERRTAVNEWIDNSVRSRLNNQKTGAIIIVMQRLHCDDLVAHVQENESWEVISFPALAETETEYSVMTPYGRQKIVRHVGEILQPEIMCEEELVTFRKSSTEYIFQAQYQQNPQPVAGNIVRREYLHFYKPPERPAEFEQIIQSWDTANKPSEMADFTVCTTWGQSDRTLFLLDVFRKRVGFPELKRTLVELAQQWRAGVLVEDQASGTQLIQQVHADGFGLVQAAPVGDGDKIMRLHAQTALIKNGFVRFPESAPWLDTYLHELLTFPSKYDDQVDSSVNALMWLTQEQVKPGMGFYHYMKEEAAKIRRPPEQKRIRVWVPGESNVWYLLGGRRVAIPADRIIEVTEEEAVPLYRAGGRKVE